ncbi:MAG: fatty acid desaturase [bacterium]|nr:fatty acid desaturase [bacterium]
MVSIKSSLNITLVLGIQVLAWGLLWFASELNLALNIFLGIIFSFLLLTNYALMHESAHHLFHPSQKLNYLFGVLSTSIFPMSFTVFELTHRVHHRGNRTDPELFDYFYPGESRIVKSIQWYGILTGLYYPFVPLGTIIMALVPWIYQTPLFTKRRTFKVLLKDFKNREVFLVRIEVLFILLYWIGMYYLLGLNLTTVLIFYGLWGINWSTRQFVAHAWSPRYIADGAIDLKVSKPHGWLLLHGNWEHVHHKFTHLPWTELSNRKYHTSVARSYLKQWMSLWKGIRLVTEPEPTPIMKVNELSQRASR